MYEKTNDELKETMFQNHFRMKKVKAMHTALMFMCLVLAFVQLIFFIAGGLNVFCLVGFAMCIVVFLSGTYSYDKEKLHIALIAVNILLAGLFLIWHPVSELLLRIGIMQHIYLAGIMFFYMRAGKEKEELSYELGYPYFNELAFSSVKDDKEYVPSEDIHKKNSYEKMQNIAADAKKIQEEPLYQFKPVVEDELPPIDTSTLDTSVMKNDTCYASVDYYKERYKTDAEPVRSSASQEILYDKELLHENFKRMKNYKTAQGGVFLVDAVIAIAAFSDMLSGIDVTRDNHFQFLHFLGGLGAIIASILTVTCTDKRELIKNSAYAFAVTAIFLTVAFFDVFYAFCFTVCALQMLVTLILCDNHDYLKTQFGYPYFKESVIHKQVYSNGYVPEHRMDYSHKKMDEI